MSKFLINTLQMQGKDLQRVCDFIKSSYSRLDFNRILPIPIGCKDKPAWVRSHWGTQFGGAFQVERIARNVYSFRTYGKAIPVIKELAKKFPDFRFRYQWSEELPGWNAGVIVYEAGKEVHRSDSEFMDELPWFGEDYLDSLTAMDIAVAL